MVNALNLYNEYKKMGIDPFQKFLGKKYEILIPLNDLDRFSYAPAYGKEYKELGIYDMTYAVNPTMYVSMYILNKLAKIFDVKFKVIEAWRPYEIQMAKYEAEQKRNPGSTLFIKPEKDKGLPHVAGGAVDLVMTNSFGEAFTQPKWLLRKNPDLINQIKPLNEDFKNVNNPFFTSHIEALDNATNDLKLSIANTELLREIVANITSLRHINDENWHFQLSDDDKEYLVSYKNISIEDVRNTTPGHLRNVKKEVSDFAEQIFGIFYNRPYEKGVKHNYSDDEFDEKNVMTLETLNQKIGVIMNKYKDR